MGDALADEDVEIVKMDATANDVPPQFNVRGFPTLYWLPKDTKVGSLLKACRDEIKRKI